MNVLMVAYEFPPIAAGGVMRTVKFAKYLSRMGHTVHVLTPRCGKGVGNDATMMNELAGEAVRVHRTRSWEFQGTRWGGLNWRIERLLKPLAVPDGMAYWAVPTIPQAWRLVKRHRIDAVYTTSWPYSDHLVGLALKKLTGTPWIADFRDPWISHHKYGLHEGRRHRVNQRIERAICRRADRIVSTTESASQVLAESHPNLSADRFCTIRNGFDEEDFAGIVANDDSFLIVHTGSFYGTRNPDGFFAGLADFLNAHPQAKSHTKVVCLGAKLDGSFQSPDINAEVTYIPWAPHADSINWIRRARVLLLVQHSEPLIRLTTPGKVYEYMATGNHIVGVNIHRGENENLLRDYGNATILHDDAPKAIADTLATLYAKYAKGELNRVDAADAIRPYSRAAGAQQLASLLDAIVSSPTGSKKKVSQSNELSYA